MNVLGVVALCILLIPVAFMLLHMNQTSGGQMFGSLLLLGGIVVVLAFGGSVVYYLAKIANKKD